MGVENNFLRGEGAKKIGIGVGRKLLLGMWQKFWVRAIFSHEMRDNESPIEILHSLILIFFDGTLFR